MGNVLVRSALYLAIALAASAATLASRSLAATLIPHDPTRALYALDNGSGNILRMNPNNGSVSIGVAAAEIVAAKEVSAPVDFGAAELQFDQYGTLFFTETESRSIYRHRAGQTTLLASRADLEAATNSEARPIALAVGTDGFVYVVDDIGRNILRIDAVSGSTSVHTSESQFEGVLGTSNFALQSGLVGGPGGSLFLASAGNPNTVEAVFEIASDGTPTVLRRGSPFQDLDGDLTRAGNGNLVFVDHAGVHDIYQMPPGNPGALSILLSKEDIEMVLGGVYSSVPGGMEFDDQGRLFVAGEDIDGAARELVVVVYDPVQDEISLLLNESSVVAATGASNAVFTDIAFATVPEPGIATLLLVLPIVTLGIRRRWTLAAQASCSLVAGVGRKPVRRAPNRGLGTLI